MAVFLAKDISEVKGSFADRFSYKNGAKAVKKDDDSETGYRFGAETGVRLELAPWARLSITGNVEHFTDVPAAVLPSFEDHRAAHVDFDDLTDWRVGERPLPSPGLK
jgi:hypothetical protein